MKRVSVGGQDGLDKDRVSVTGLNGKPSGSVLRIGLAKTS